MHRVCAVVVGLLCTVGAAGIAAPADAASYQQLYHFPAPGRGDYPTGDLIAAGGKLYGTTAEGGSIGSGEVFSLATAGEATVYSFIPGTTGLQPRAGLLDVNGLLYGTTEGGEPAGYPAGQGTVFAVNPTTGSQTLLYAFQGGSDGQIPTGNLIDVGGVLYGTTQQGGGSATCSDGCGTVFAVNLTTGAETVVHAFTGGSDGAAPAASLIDVNGTLYGTTAAGGSANCNTHGCGTVFALNPTTGAEQVVHAFQGGTDGASPSAGLLDVSGTLYSTTGLGGLSNDGTVFSLNLATGAETVVHSFQGGTDGVDPVADLIDVGGTLYGTTELGGPSFIGTVFSLKLSTGSETVVHAFTGHADGSYPEAGLVNAGGTLYGASSMGGSTHCDGQGCGTVFSVTP